MESLANNTIIDVNLKNKNSLHVPCTLHVHVCTCTLLMFKHSLGQTTSVWLVVVAKVVLCFCFEVFLTLDNLHVHVHNR